MSDESSAPELVAPVSGVVLTLMAHLRQSTLPSGEALETLPSRGAITSAWRDDGRFICILLANQQTLFSGNVSQAIYRCFPKMPNKEIKLTLFYWIAVSVLNCSS